MPSVADLPQPPSPNGKEVFIPVTRADWRAWLQANSARNEGVWVVYCKLTSPVDGPTHEDLVEEALCFGWIDSLTKRVDQHRLIQWYTPRRKGAQWSRVNKRRIERLVAAGLMHERGQAVIDAAKADGSWTLADAVEDLIVPAELEEAFAAAPAARAAYEALAPSIKKQHLWAIYSAKRPETRSKRAAALVEELSSASR
ncbi:MAG TPA: YdeI/OmpD-associated family protein [Acidimicrobiia bacterium]|nr:YdeI/OmpD-associated family protein [Acidimicrobiia bacterium]